MIPLPPPLPRYNIDERQQAVRDQVRAFCEKENIVELGRQLDRKPEPPVFPRGLYKKLCQAGFVGYPFSKEYGRENSARLVLLSLKRTAASDSIPRKGSLLG